MQSLLNYHCYQLKFFTFASNIEGEIDGLVRYCTAAAVLH